MAKKTNFLKENKYIEARKRDMLIIRIVDWSDDKPTDEPAIDVEVYADGEFQFDDSKVFSISGDITKARAVSLARAYVADFVQTFKFS